MFVSVSDIRAGELTPEVIRNVVPYEAGLERRLLPIFVCHALVLVPALQNHSP